VAERQLPVKLTPATQKQRDFLATLALNQGAPVNLVLASYGQTKAEASNALSRLTAGGAMLHPRTGKLCSLEDWEKEQKDEKEQKKKSERGPFITF